MFIVFKLRTGSMFGSHAGGGCGGGAGAGAAKGAPTTSFACILDPRFQAPGSKLQAPGSGLRLEVCSRLGVTSHALVPRQAGWADIGTCMYVCMYVCMYIFRTLTRDRRTFEGVSCV